MKTIIRLGRADAIQRAIDNGYDLDSNEYIFNEYNVLTYTFIYFKYTTIKDYFVKRNYEKLEKTVYEMLEVLLKNGANPNV